MKNIQQKNYFHRKLIPTLCVSYGGMRSNTFIALWILASVDGTKSGSSEFAKWEEWNNCLNTKLRKKVYTKVKFFIWQRNDLSKCQYIFFNSISYLGLIPDFFGSIPFCGRFFDDSHSICVFFDEFMTETVCNRLRL